MIKSIQKKIGQLKSMFKTAKFEKQRLCKSAEYQLTNQNRITTYIQQPINCKWKVAAI